MEEELVMEEEFAVEEFEKVARQVLAVPTPVSAVALSVLMLLEPHDIVRLIPRVGLTEEGEEEVELWLQGVLAMRDVLYHIHLHPTGLEPRELCKFGAFSAVSLAVWYGRQEAEADAIPEAWVAPGGTA